MMFVKVLCNSRVNLFFQNIYKKQFVNFSNSRLFFDNKKQNELSYKSDHFYDVIISGGGMVGAALAASLGDSEVFHNKKILLLEAGKQKSNEFQPDSPFSSRVCALNPASKDLLDSFGAWKRLSGKRYKEVKRMQVWDACSDALITFNHADMQTDLAYIVENELVLDSILSQIHANCENVSIQYDTNVTSFNIPQNHKSITQLAEIHLADGKTLKTKLLVGADGYKSLARKTADIHTTEWDYEQSAVVAVLKLSEPCENNVAWQRFLETGPIALLPLSSEYSCLVWSNGVENSKTLLSLPSESFVDAVNSAFWSTDDINPLASRLGSVFDGLLNIVGLDGRTARQLPPTIVDVVQGSQAKYPLGMCHATHYVKPRLALIGDSAHRIHPLAGQGVNLGFGDVACLRDSLVQAVEEGADIGSLGHLLDYERTRQRHVLPVMATVEALHRLYKTSFTPIVLLRSLGLQATNALSPLKDMIINKAR